MHQRKPASKGTESDLVQVGYIDKVAEAIVDALKKAWAAIMKAFNAAKKKFLGIVHKVVHFFKMIWKIVKKPRSIFGVCYAYFSLVLSKASQVMEMEVDGWIMGVKMKNNLKIDMKSIPKSLMNIFKTIYNSFKKLFKGGNGAALKCGTKTLSSVGNKKAKVLKKMKLPSMQQARILADKTAKQNELKYKKKQKAIMKQKKAKAEAYRKAGNMKVSQI
jgi:hypothetical protein